MRTYKVKGATHIVYDSKDELPDSMKYTEDWRECRIGDWALANDGCIIQVLRAGKMTQKKGSIRYIGTCTGTFLVLDRIKMDTDKRPNIYSFGGHATPEEAVQKREVMTSGEELFVQYLASGMSSEDAYLKAFPTNNRQYAKMKSVNLIRTERIKTAMKEELKPVLEELGINETSILDNINTIAMSSEKDETRLKALFKLSDIMDLEDKNTQKVQQLTGAIFQGFTENMVKEVERPKKLKK